MDIKVKPCKFSVSWQVQIQITLFFLGLSAELNVSPLTRSYENGGLKRTGGPEHQSCETNGQFTLNFPADGQTPLWLHQFCCLLYHEGCSFLPALQDLNIYLILSNLAGGQTSVQPPTDLSNLQVKNKPFPDTSTCLMIRFLLGQISVLVLL